MDEHTAKALSELKTRLLRRYGNRLVKIVLFGSRARGTHRPDSDLDVAVYFDDLCDRWQRQDEMADIATDVMLSFDPPIAITAFALPETALRDDSNPFMQSIRREGVAA